MTGSGLILGCPCASTAAQVSVPQGGVGQPARAFQCTPSAAGVLIGQILSNGAVVHRFTAIVAAAALNPSVDSVSPETANMSELLTLTVKGNDLPDSLEVALNGCSNLRAGERSATEQRFSCQPTQTGALTGTVSANGSTCALHRGRG